MTAITVEPIRKQIVVAAPPEKAFEIFTDMTRWWNPEFTIGGQPFETVVLEPREGGRWFERDADGNECDWGRVVAWEPPTRLVLTWQIGADWQFHDDVVTELEVTFTPDHADATRVDLEHRGLEAMGDQAEMTRRILDSPGGWAGLLERLAAAMS